MLISIFTAYPPVLLERKAVKLRKEIGHSRKDDSRVRTPFEGKDRTLKHILTKASVRPFKLFVREPIIQVLGVYMAFMYVLFNIPIHSNFKN